MKNGDLLGAWIRRFLLEYLITERNLSANTQRSYRDTMAILMPYLGRILKRSVDRIGLDDLNVERIKSFLHYLEQSRSCGASTRNQRLSAIHSLARFISLHCPQHVVWYGQIRSIPMKKTATTLVSYLEKPEMDALLRAPDQRTPLGRRDYAILLFLYNSGARADEAARVAIKDLDLRSRSTLPSVQLFGKGNKQRRCPLWKRTVEQLAAMVAERSPAERVFLNRCAQPFTRFGIYAIVKRYSREITNQYPRLRGMQLSPHVIRHTTATHLLRAGVDINTIRAWLGHVSLNTTNIYVETDLQMKAKALSQFDNPTDAKRLRSWKNDHSLMAFLRSL